MADYEPRGLSSQPGGEGSPRRGPSSRTGTVSVRGGGPRGSGALFNGRPNPSPGPIGRVRLQKIGMRPAGRRRPSWARRLSGMLDDLPAPALGDKQPFNRLRAANLCQSRGLPRPARHKLRPGPAPGETPGLVPGHYGRPGRSKVEPGVKGRHETRGGRAPGPSRRVSEPPAADPRVFLAGGDVEGSLALSGTAAERLFGAASFPDGRPALAEEQACGMRILKRSFRPARSLGLAGGEASPSGDLSSPRDSGGGALSPGLAAGPLSEGSGEGRGLPFPGGGQYENETNF
jgi:hypothetical protein